MNMFGMGRSGVNWNERLDTKYALQSRATGADELRAQAAMTGAQAEQGKAGAAMTGAAADALRAQQAAQRQELEAPFYGDLLKSEIESRRAAAGESGARRAELLEGISFGRRNPYSFFGPLAVPGSAKGETKVPGMGSGKVDTVPRMLAPGEAVLNKAAANFLGRGMIKKLNQMGAKKMGLS